MAYPISDKIPKLPNLPMSQKDRKAITKLFLLSFKIHIWTVENSLRAIILTKRLTLEISRERKCYLLQSSINQKKLFFIEFR